MASAPTQTTPVATPKGPQPQQTGSEALGELGRTTSSRAWIALVALLLVIVAFTFYGLFGTIPVQSTIPATVTNGSYPIEITAQVTGTVTAVQIDQHSSATLPAGTQLMSIKPSTGGKAIEIKTPVEMSVSLDVIEGSPVIPETVVAHGSQVSSQGSDGGHAQVYAFLSLDVVQSVKTAQSLTVTPTAPSLAGTPAPIQVAFVGAVPVSQDQIALLTGNTIYAQQAYSDAGGTPYAVLFKYLNASDANQVTGTAAAEITVTESTPHPLQLLFSQ